MEASRKCVEFSSMRLVHILSFLVVMITHCDARKSVLLTELSHPHKNQNLKHFKILEMAKNLNMLIDVSVKDSSNTESYENSQFTLPPYNSLSPHSLPNDNKNSPPYCVYPPPDGSQSPPTTTPSPTDENPTPYPYLGPPYSPIGLTPSPDAPQTSYSPPITNPPEIEPSPPSGDIPSPTSGDIPSPPSGSSGDIPSPTSGNIPSPSSDSSGDIPSPSSGLSGGIPSPTSGEIPSPSSGSSGDIPSPPSGSSGGIPSPSGEIPTPSSPTSGAIPSPPEFVPSPTGFEPSPPVFEPPDVYPPPTTPPPPRTSGGGGHGSGTVWCVAKPSVPDPIIQEAMNYACSSGADCGPIQPNGPCFHPNTILAHASYAFNSYWQRTKVAGGTCSFGGTAILVTVNPSSGNCQFVSV